MIPRLFVTNLRKALRRFRTARRGNVVITFALSLFPIMGLVGAAVDYSRGTSSRVEMQQAIDAAGLMLSKEAASMNAAQLSIKAEAYFKALINRQDITDVVVTPTLQNPGQSNFVLAVVATAKVPTTFTKILGLDNMNLRVDTEVRWGVKKLELALALDNTGSMSSSGKMTELKKAATNLIDTLTVAAKAAGDIKVSIIPFYTAVRVGNAFKNATWIDWSEAYGTCSNSTYKNKTTCQSAGKTWTATSGGALTTAQNNWKGCVMDRTQPNDTLDTAPVVGQLATLFPATPASENTECNGLATALPLTDIWGAGATTLKNKIAAMQPSGTTNVTIGLAWGWHSLTSSQPFPEGAVPDPNVDKVIILLTDGDNTENRWTTNQAAIDPRTTAACTNVKAPGPDPNIPPIKLYTIRVIDGNATLLKNCATSPSMYYDVQTASQLNSVFAQIADALANRRIAK